MMENSLKIESITNGILTIQKIRDLYKNGQRLAEGSSNNSVHPDKLMLMREVLSTVAELLPQTRSGIFSNAFEQGTRFSGAYRELKRQVGSMSRGTPRQEDFFKTLRLLLPILDLKHKVYMDKLVRIVDVLMS